MNGYEKEITDLKEEINANTELAREFNRKRKVEIAELESKLKLEFEKSGQLQLEIASLKEQLPKRKLTKCDVCGIVHVKSVSCPFHDYHKWLYDIQEVLRDHLKSHMIVAREQLTDKDKMTIFKEFDEAIEKQLEKLDSKVGFAQQTEKKECKKKVYCQQCNEFINNLLQGGKAYCKKGFNCYEHSKTLRALYKHEDSGGSKPIVEGFDWDKDKTKPNPCCEDCMKRNETKENCNVYSKGKCPYYKVSGARNL